MRVIETTLDEDLSLFSGYLWQHRVRHRIFEEQGRQVLEIADSEAAQSVRASYSAWRSGELILERQASPGTTFDERLAKGFELLRRYPVLAGIIAISLLVFPFSSGGELTSVTAWLTVVDLRNPGNTTHLFESMELWRWFTPVFLHFSVVHLLFNLAVMSDFGRRVELARGSVQFGAVVLAIGVLSNCGQLLIGGNPLFGGLSGVAYGLLGFVLVNQRRFPDEPAWQVNTGFAFSLLLFLMIFSTGITEPFGLYVANAAHWIGLVSGGVLALVIPGQSRRSTP